MKKWNQTQGEIIAERVWRGGSFIVLVFAAAVFLVFLGCLLGVAVAGEPCECVPCDPLSASISRLENLESRLYVLQDRRKKGEAVLVLRHIFDIQWEIREVKNDIKELNRK